MLSVKSLVRFKYAFDYTFVFSLAGPVVNSAGLFIRGQNRGDFGFSLVLNRSGDIVGEF